MKFKVFEKLYEAYKMYKPQNVELTIDKIGVKIYVEGGEIGYIFIQEPIFEDDFFVANFLAKIETSIELMRGIYKTRIEFEEAVNKRIENYINAFKAYKKIGKANLIREVLNG